MIFVHSFSTPLISVKFSFFFKCNLSADLPVPTPPITSNKMIMPPVSATSAVSLSGDCQQQAKQSIQSSSADGHHSSSSSSASSSAIVGHHHPHHHHHHSMMQPSTPNSNSGTAASSPLVDCAGCGSTILDRFYLSAVDRHWHVSCLKCSQCKVDLQGEPSCFSRDGLIFCKADYYRLFSMRRCSRCGEGIYASELVMRVRDQNVYHVQCFTCAWCATPLAQGDLFGVRDSLVYCRTHYEMLCSSSSSSSGGGPGGGSAAGGAGGAGGSCAREGREGGSRSPNGVPSSPAGVAEAAGAALLHHHPNHHLLQHPNGPSSPPLLGPPHHHLHLPHHQHPHLPHHHPLHPHHHPLHHPSLLHHPLDLPPDGCSSSLAATPYATSSSSLYSPLSIHGSGGGGGGGNAGPPSSSAPGSAPNGQSPTTPHSIRKGRPRKRKNAMGASSEAQQANDSMTLLNSSGGGNNSSCTHDSLSPTGARSSHSPGGSLDGGPLSGLAASIENSCLSGSSSGGLGGLSHSSQRTKRMRTSFKHHQLRTMKTYFSVNQNPDAKDLKQLAQKTGLSKRVLQVWFQNARAKWRRNNLKMMPDGPELSLNGQTLLGSLGHPSTPSTVIGSPGGSTRPFSSPSPSSALSPSTMHDGGSCGGGGGGSGQLGNNNTSTATSNSSLHSQPQSSVTTTSSLLDHSASVLGSFGHPHQRVHHPHHHSDHSVGGLLPLSFQELY